MTRWYIEKKREHFYKEAKRVGYRARSAFKLQQIQKKFGLLSVGNVVLDLGAAPGGWSQDAQELDGEQGTVIGIDLSSIRPLEHVSFIQGDMTEHETVEKIEHLLNGSEVDIVLSDMSPDISGNYSVDQARSIWLCGKAFEVTTAFLKPGGHFVCKIFEGEDTKDFIEKVKRRFYNVKMFLPVASRKSSSEIYLIAQNLRT